MAYRPQKWPNPSPTSGPTIVSTKAGTATLQTGLDPGSFPERASAARPQIQETSFLNPRGTDPQKDFLRCDKCSLDVENPFPDLYVGHGPPMWAGSQPASGKEVS